MAYTDLLPKLSVVSIAEDGSSFTITDSTGTVSAENPGGYAAPGDGTATRPSFDQTLRFFFFQKTPFSDEANLAAPFLPESQNADNPFVMSPSLLDEFGVPFPQTTYRGILFVVPDSMDLDVIRDGIAADGIDFWVLQIQEDGAVGYLPIVVENDNIICTNQSRADAINNLVKNGCCTAMFYQKNAQLQGITMTMGVYPTYDVISPQEEALFVEGQAQIDTLNRVCEQSPCCDTC